MKTEKFPIGFWQHAKRCENTPENVKEWAALGMTVAFLSPFGDGDDPKKILDVLDACEKYGMKAVLHDLRVMWHGASDEPEKYTEKFKAAYEMFGHHPAVLGFHIGDEPSNEKGFADCVAAHRIQKEIAPELTPYLNFLPYKADVSERLLGTSDFHRWLTDIVNRGQIEILSYDCYSHMRGNLEGVNTYFSNLLKFTAAAKETGAAPWNCLLSSGHYDFRCPSEDDLRWQLHTSVASGMKGVAWFIIYAHEPLSNIRLIPINEFGERTETFGWLSRVNRYFLKQYGDFFNKAEHISTYHLVNAYGGYGNFIAGAEDDAVLGIESASKVDGLVSYFTLDGEKYLVLVNNTPDKNGRFTIKAKADREYAAISWDGTLATVKSSVHHDSGRNVDYCILFDDWLAPGQMKVFRI